MVNTEYTSLVEEKDSCCSFWYQSDAELIAQFNESVDCRILYYYYASKNHFHKNKADMLVLCFFLFNRFMTLTRITGDIGLS